MTAGWTASTQALYDLVTSQTTVAGVRDVIANHAINLPENSTVVLYSGNLVNGFNTGAMAQSIADNLNEVPNVNGAVSIINNTDVGRVLSNSDFSNFFFQLAVDEGYSAVEVPIPGTEWTTSEVKSLLNDPIGPDGQPGLWATASDNLASSAHGNVITLSAFADPTRVFGATEFQALLDNPNVTSIDGIPKADIQLFIDNQAADYEAAGLSPSEARAKALSDSVSHVSGKSMANLADNVQFAIGSDGKVSVKVNAAFFDAAGSGNLPAFDSTNGASLNNLHDLAKPEDWASSIEKLHGAEKFLKSIGFLETIGETLAFAALVVNVKQLIDAGKNGEAAAEISSYLTELTGGMAGGAIAREAWQRVEKLFTSKKFLSSMLKGGPWKNAATLVTVVTAGSIAGSEGFGRIMDAMLSFVNGDSSVVGFLKNHQETIASAVAAFLKETNGQSGDYTIENGFIEFTDWNKDDGPVYSIHFKPYNDGQEFTITVGGSEVQLDALATALQQLALSNENTLLQLYAKKWLVDNGFGDPETDEAIAQFNADPDGPIPEVNGRPITDILNDAQSAAEADLAAAIRRTNPDYTDSQIAAAIENGQITAEMLEAALEEIYDKEDFVVTKVEAGENANGEIQLLPLGPWRVSQNGVQLTTTTSVFGDEVVDVEILIQGESIDLGSFASIFGSTLGRQIAGNSQLEQIVVGTLSGVLADNIAETVAGLFLPLDENYSNVFEQAFADFGANLATASVGAVSSFLTGELIGAIGLDGIEGELANAIGGSAIGQIANNIILRVSTPQPLT